MERKFRWQKLRSLSQIKAKNDRITKIRFMNSCENWIVKKMMVQKNRDNRYIIVLEWSSTTIGMQDNKRFWESDPIDIEDLHKISKEVKKTWDPGL